MHDFVVIITKNIRAFAQEGWRSSFSPIGPVQVQPKKTYCDPGPYLSAQASDLRHVDFTPLQPFGSFWTWYWKNTMVLTSLFQIPCVLPCTFSSISLKTTFFHPPLRHLMFVHRRGTWGMSTSPLCSRLTSFWTWYWKNTMVMTCLLYTSDAADE